MPDPRDRRSAERFPVNADTSCQFVRPVGDELGHARIKNVSTDGIGLLLSKRVEPGSLLAIALMVKGKPFNRTLLVQVAHVTAQPGGSFLVGGNFVTPLTYDDLKTLVM
jgi:hypothetical protein